MIGVFDSGVGGLTVIKEIFKQLPGYPIIYFGDTARLPYGTKGEKFVKKYSEKITGWLLQKKVKIVVIACNTSSAWSADHLKNRFKGLPIFEMINPAIEGAVSCTRNNKIGIIGTPGTIRSGVYKKKLRIKNIKKIYQQACPLLVPLVEEGFVEGSITREIIKKYLKPLKQRGIDTLILGCTHYPLLSDEISKLISSKIKIINPAENIVNELKRFLEKHPEISRDKKESKFYFSDEPYNLKKISHLCFNKNIKPIVKDPFNE